MPDGVRPNGWYRGRNKKYYDMFDLTAEKKDAYVFDEEKTAKDIARSLNKNGWNFVVLTI